MSYVRDLAGIAGAGGFWPSSFGIEALSIALVFGIAKIIFCVQLVRVLDWWEETKTERYRRMRRETP